MRHLSNNLRHILTTDDDSHSVFYSENTEMHARRLAIGKHASSIYALESMLYLTTGIMDKHINTNSDLETAIFKVNYHNKFDSDNIK